MQVFQNLLMLEIKVAVIFFSIRLSIETCSWSSIHRNCCNFIPKCLNCNIILWSDCCGCSFWYSIFYSLQFFLFLNALFVPIFCFCPRTYLIKRQTWPHDNYELKCQFIFCYSLLAITHEIETVIFFSDGALLIMNPVKVVILLVNRLEGEGLRDKIAHS